MCNLTMIRTIWPVGQGAFYTEKFQNGNNHFNVVYDCGSFGPGNSRETPDCLLQQINKAELNQVDLLFISHFHWDHINGVQQLMTEAGNGRTRLVMPEMSKVVRSYYFLSILIDSGLGDEIIASSNNQQDGGQNNSIQTANYYRNLVWSNGENVISVEDSGYIRLRFGEEDGRITIDANTGVITEDEINKAIEKHQRIWAYCIKLFGKHELEAEASAMLARINNINAELVNDLNEGNYNLLTNNIWDRVKKEYEDANRTIANNNSLIVLSTPLYPFNYKSYIDGLSCQCFCRCRPARINCKMCSEHFRHIPPSALYTGDREIDIDWESLFNPNCHFLHYMPLGIYQMSHHGQGYGKSANNDNTFNIEMPNSIDAIVSFCCYGSKNRYNHPDLNLLKYYYRQGIYSFAIDDFNKPLIQRIESER